MASHIGSNHLCSHVYVVFHPNFAVYIVCWRYKLCEFLGFVWTDCWGNKSYYVITSPANWIRFICGVLHNGQWHMCSKILQVIALSKCNSFEIDISDDELAHTTLRE